MRLSIPVCNFQSMKSTVDLNSILWKFFWYVTWFHERRNWKACKQGLFLKSYRFFETMAYGLAIQKLQLRRSKCKFYELGLETSKLV